MTTEISLKTLQDHIEKAFVGKTSIVQNALITLLSGGHLLIEDVPGVGKTTLAVALARALGCTFQRIQFTSDMMPSDILGVSVLNPRTQEFEFRPGPIFHQVVLADELNRATPRTQSALLECMNERQVSLDGHTHALPDPFFVLATQNPHEHHGTFALPESQLDRFTMRLSIGYPDAQHERSILALGSTIDPSSQSPCIDAEQMLRWIGLIRMLHVAPLVDDYLLAIIDATRHTKGIALGASPRGAIALRRSAQARAFLDKRDHVTPDDVKSLAVPVLAHRVMLDGGPLGHSRLAAEQAILRVLDDVAVPI